MQISWSEYVENREFNKIARLLGEVLEQECKLNESAEFKKSDLEILYESVKKVIEIQLSYNKEYVDFSDARLTYKNLQALRFNMGKEHANLPNITQTVNLIRHVMLHYDPEWERLNKEMRQRAYNGDQEYEWPGEKIKQVHQNMFQRAYRMVHKIIDFVKEYFRNDPMVAELKADNFKWLVDEYKDKKLPGANNLIALP